MLENKTQRSAIDNPQIIASSVALGQSSEFVRQARPLPRGFSAHRGRILGHSHPDNSRGSIIQVIRAQVPYLELDLRRAFDGEIYLYHDKRIGVDGSRVPFNTVMGDWLKRLYPEVLSFRKALKVICREEKSRKEKGRGAQPEALKEQRLKEHVLKEQGEELGIEDYGVLVQLDMKVPEAQVVEMIEEVIAIAARISRDSCRAKNRPKDPHSSLAIADKSLAGSQFRKDLSRVNSRNLAATLASKLIFQCQDMTCARYLAGHQSNAMWLARLHSEDDLAELLRLKPEIVQIGYSATTEELINKIHEAGSLVLVKSLGTQDNEKTWEMLRLRGVDIILSDLGVNESMR